MKRMAQTTEVRVYSRLPVLRAERGLSRQEVADAVGVHYQTVGYLERGEYSPSLALALRISAFFELPVEAIFSLEPMKPMSERIYGGRDHA
jgi:putative transcriptional regulator